MGILDTLNEMASVATVTPPVANVAPVQGAAATVLADNPSPVVDVTAQGPVVAKAYEKQKGALDNLEHVVTSAQIATGPIEDRMLALASHTDATRQVLTADEQARAARLGEQARPVLANRNAVQQRIVEVSQMNPIIRAFRGFVDKNYDMDHLEEQSQALSGQAASIGNEFAIGHEGYAAAMEAANASYTSSAGLADLMKAHIASTVTDAKDNYSVAQMGLQLASQGIGLNTQVLEGLHAAKSVIIDGIADPKIAYDYLAKATKDPHKQVTINGVSVSAGDLKQRATSLEAQQLAMEGQRLGVMTGQLNYSNAREREFIAHMSPSERATAAQAGGKFRGMQLNPEYLGAALEGDKSVATAGALAGDSVGAIGTYNQTIHAFAQTAGTFGQRLAIAGSGTVPNDYTTLVQNRTRELNSMSSKLTAMPEGEAKDKLATAYTAKVQEWAAGRDKLSDDYANRMTTNPDLRIGLKSWMLGQPLAPEQAVKSILAAIRTGTQIPGFNPGGISGPTMRLVQQKVKEVYDQYGGQGSAESTNLTGGYYGAKHLAKGELDIKLQQAVVGAIKAGGINARFDTANNALPGWAAADKNPAGRIKPENLAAAQHTGEGSGYAAMAKLMNLPESDVASMFSPGGEAKFENWKKHAGTSGNDPNLADFNSAAGMLHTYQIQGMFRELRRTSGTPTFDPAAAYVNFFNSPNFQNRVAVLDQRFPHADMTANLISSVLGPNSVTSTVHGLGPRYRLALAKMDSQDQEDRVNRVRLYNGDPLTRSATIVHSMPGLNTAAADAVQSYIDHAVKNHYLQGAPAESDMGASMMGVPEAGMQIVGSQQNQFIDNLVIHTKWNDPQLEAVRKKIAPQWEAHSVSIDRAVHKLGN